MSDPRQEQREAVTRMQRAPLTTQQALERIKQRLSPCDDDLPLAQAVRQRDEMQRSVEAFRKRHGEPK